MMNENIPQFATVRIQCNGTTGTGVMYFPGDDCDYMYVFTAKHCLVGEHFAERYVITDITIDKIFNAQTKVFHSYRLQETDRVICSIRDEDDLALIILPKQPVISLTGKAFSCPVANSIGVDTPCVIRGFANFNIAQEDRPLAAVYLENVKNSTELFLVKAVDELDTYYQQALNNVKGLSGSGLFIRVERQLYLAGIVHTYEDKNLFMATKMEAYNQLIPHGKYRSIRFVTPEVNEDIIRSFDLLDRNKASINVRTRDTIAHINIERDFGEAKNVLAVNRMLVLHGKPGVGKSALAKALANDLEQETDSIVMAFTSEQLYESSLDIALMKIGHKVDLRQLLSSPLARKRIYIWIESFEKLMEAGFDGTFNELLTLLKNDRRISIILTMRDYMVQKFKISYQYELPALNIFHPIKEFTDMELLTIQQKLPDIVPLLANEKLYPLLRIPYYLDRAVRIYPELLKVTHLDVVGFKKLMWEHIVEAGDRERGIVFSDIALKRAREMSLFTTSDASLAVIDRLIKDNILQAEQGELANRYSPSHDILEDWALIRYIKQKRQDADHDQFFLEHLDNSPAIRRAFRLWLEELYQHEPEMAHVFSKAIFANHIVEQFWKDDLIIAILRSNSADALLQSMQAELFASEGKLLRHFIHLLRTGCKTFTENDHDFDKLVPVGSGWDALIEFLKAHHLLITEIGGFEYLTILLILDWGKQLPEYNSRQLPSSSESAASLLVHFIEKFQDKLSFDHRRSTDLLERECIGLLLKLTAVTKPEIASLLAAVQDPEKTIDRSWFSKQFLYGIQHLLVSGVHSDQICKYFPEIIIKLAWDVWKEKEASPIPGSLHSYIREEKGSDYWGMDRNLDYDYDLPSAYQTFFYWMFLHHPSKAIDFFLDFLNYAFEKNQTGRSMYEEEKQLVQLTLPEGTTATYYASSGYWSMFRGANVSHKIVVSLLMALEKGMLDLARRNKASHNILQNYLSKLIKDTNNVAVLAVVCSVIQANPDLLDETSVKLLGVKQFYDWDGARSAAELMPLNYYSDDPFLAGERRASDRLPHRTGYFRGLIGFVSDYMFYTRSINELLFAEIDVLWSEAPPDNIYWRKALFDMDCRKYNLTPIDQPGFENIARFGPGYDEAVEALVNSSDLTDKFPKYGTVWAKNVFEGKNVDDSSYKAWQDGYQFIMELDGAEHFMVSPNTMACIGIRDYLSQLSADETAWCKSEILTAATQILKARQSSEFGTRTFDQEPVLYALPLLFKLPLDTTQELEVRTLIFNVLISRLDERPKTYLEFGIAEVMWQLRPGFALSCWYGLLEFIEIQKQLDLTRRPGYPYGEDDRDILIDENDRLADNWKALLIDTVVQETVTQVELVHMSLHMATHRYLDDALRIIPIITDLSVHRHFVGDLLQMHLTYLKTPRRGSQSDFYDSRHVFQQFYAKYLLAQPAELSTVHFRHLLDQTIAVDALANEEKATEYIYKLVKQVIFATSDWPSLTQPIARFWLLWEQLRDWILETKKGYLLPLFLIDVGWNERWEDWSILEGKKDMYQNFILRYGLTNINASLRLITGIGLKKFMPISIWWAADMLRSEKESEATTSLVELLAHKAFFKYGNLIKGNKGLLNEYFFILDLLIKRGSPKAYMLKEEMIQYK